MRFLVDEMPEEGSECPFFKDGNCTLDKDEYCDFFNGEGKRMSAGYVDECGHMKAV